MLLHVLHLKLLVLPLQDPLLYWLLAQLIALHVESLHVFSDWYPIGSDSPRRTQDPLNLQSYSFPNPFGQCLLVALAIRVFYDELSSFHWLLFHHANLNLETEP